jgi:hypothetical protein
MVGMASVGPWWTLIFFVVFVGPLVRFALHPNRDWRYGGRWYRSRDREREAELEAMTGELQARVAQIDALESRVLELESRLDFAERLLARPAVSDEARSEESGGSRVSA